MKHIFLTGIISLAASCSIRAHADNLKIVATLPSFAAIAQEVGGDLVTVSSVASPQFNPHFIEARPSDVLRLKRADLFIHGGLDLEAWRGPLVDAAARSEIRRGGPRELDLSLGISLLKIPQRPASRAEGDIHLYGNPHYWMNPENGLIIARAIAAKLSELDPSNSARYQQQLNQFIKRLEEKIQSWKSSAQPVRGKEVLGYHDEWVYLMNFLEIRMERFVEPKPGIPPAPRQLAALEEYIKQQKIRALLQPTYYSKDASDNLSSSTGVAVLLLCQNVGELPECGNYIEMFDYDISRIVAAVS